MNSRRLVISNLCSLTALLTLGQCPGVFAATNRRKPRYWVSDLQDLVNYVRNETVTIDEWRTGLETLFTHVPLKDLLLDIDFDRLRERTSFAQYGVKKLRVNLDDDKPLTLRFNPILFAIGKGRAIVPHGHANMLSAHILLSGQLHLRQYDQLERSSTALLIRPSDEKIIFPGEISSIGLKKDNVHWFVAERDSYALDVIVSGLDEMEKKRYEVFNLDMRLAEANQNGTLLAPRIGVKEALAKYG